MKIQMQKTLKPQFDPRNWLDVVNLAIDLGGKSCLASAMGVDAKTTRKWMRRGGSPPAKDEHLEALVRLREATPRRNRMPP